MKPASPALVTYLAAQATLKSVSAKFADLFTITLVTGQTIYSTGADVDISYGGNLFVHNGLYVKGLKYKSTIGLDADQQDTMLVAAAGWALNGATLPQAIRNGAFDGATLQRDRLFFSDYVGGTQIGDVLLFKGLFLSIKAGALAAQATVANDLRLLDQPMPRNVFTLRCNHTLYDSGCTLSKASYATTGTVQSGTTASAIATSVALAAHVQGIILFTSGVANGLQAGVADVNSGTVSLTYPLPVLPAVGDSFTLYQGCDHTKSTCQAKFNNLANFRGYPFIPAPQQALTSS
jgi:uncharacterized phage protein (TIGR02218 family)